MEPHLMWTGITIVVNVAFQEILALIRLRQSSKRVTVQTKMQSLVIYWCNWFVTDLFIFQNGTHMPISNTGHTWKQITHSWVIDILWKPVRELFTSNCHHLYRIHVLMIYRNVPFKTILWNIFFLSFKTIRWNIHYFFCKYHLLV